MMTLRRRLLIEWLLILAVGIAAVSLATQWRATAAFDRLVYDRLASLSRPEPARAILIVNIDEPSLKAIGKWPWSRSSHAALIKKLHADKPRSILLDILLSEPSEADADAALAQAMRLGTPVYLPVNFASPGNEGRAFDIERPIPVLEKNAAGTGHVNILFDDDGTVRRTNLCFQPEPGATRWSHIAELVYRGGGRASVAFAADRSCTRPLLLPYAPRDSFAEISYADVLNGRIPAELVRGRDIIIGASAAGMGDVYAAPFGDGGSIPGTEIIANILSAIRTDNFIRPADRPYALAFALLPMLILMAGFLRWRPRTALFASAILVLLVLGLSAGGLAARIWLPPGASLLGILLIYPLWGWRRLQAMSAFMDRELRDLRREGDIVPVRKPDPATDMVGRQSSELASAIDHLRDLRRFVSDSLEHLPDPMFVTAPNGVVTMASHQLDAYLRTPLQGMTLGALLDHIVNPAHRALVDHYLAAPAAGRENAEDFVRFAAPDGKQFVMRTADILDDRNRVIGHIHYLTDITALAKAEADREQALQLLSHDMRAPQSAIIAMLPSLPDPATRQRIERHARRTIQLAQDFVDIARMGETPFEGVDLLFGDLVKDVADGLWPLAEERGVRILVDDDTGGGFVHAEPDSLSRAIANLFDNAIKYSPQGGTIHATITREDAAPSLLHLMVADEGDGIHPSVFGQIFSRFAARGAADNRIKSSGLGLSFVAAVAARHHGSVRAENGEQGARFHLILPESVED